MEFPCRAILALVLLSLSPVDCSDSDHEIRASLAVSQVALAEQSSTMAQHSQALSQHSQALAQILEENKLNSQGMSQVLTQLIETREQSQLEAQGISQALIQMTQSFQEAIIQLTQELSRQQSASLTQLTKELSSQQSAFLTTLNQDQCREHSSSLSQMSEELRQIFTSSEEINENITNMSKSFQEAVNNLSREYSSSLSQMSETSELLQITLNQKTESLHQIITQMGEGLQESLGESLQELSLSSQQVSSSSKFEVPPGFEKVSDGWFLLVQVKKTWDDAKHHCKELGADLAIPPRDEDAFRAFITNKIGVVDDVWIGSRLFAPNKWTHVNGLPVYSSEWYSDEPDENDDCIGTDGDAEPLFFGASCTDTFFFMCRYH